MKLVRLVPALLLLALTTYQLLHGDSLRAQSSRIVLRLEPVIAPETAGE